MSIPRSRLGFTILESLIMLVILTVFSMVTFAVFRKGITRSPDADDPEWKKKGGDASMAVISGAPDPLTPEQSGLGGGGVQEAPANENAKPGDQ